MSLRPVQASLSAIGFRLLLLACLLGSSACLHGRGGTAGLVRPRGFSPTRSTEATLEQAPPPQRWALVVGIDAYSDRTFEPLRHAVGDARAVAEALRDPRGGRFDHVILLDGPERTRRNDVLLELRRLRAELRRDDTFLFYFSGHGSAELGADGSPLYYLVASNSASGELHASGIELRALLAFLGTFRTESSLAIFDSCFSGQGRSHLSAQTRDQLQRIPNPWAQLQQALERSESILMATVPGGAALEDDTLGHGIFTWSLLQALTDQRSQADSDGDGAITPYEAFDFARSLTLARTREKQVPEAWFRVTGRGELSLAGPLDGSRPRDARVSAYGTRNEGLALEVDGRTRGTFPRTVAVAPGRRQLRVLDASGAPLAVGALRLEPDGRLTVEELVETLRTPRLLYSVGPGLRQQVLGPGAVLWGAGVAGVNLAADLRLRDGRWKGLSAGLELGWMPVTGGIWAQTAPELVRTQLELGLRTGWTWRARTLELLLAGEARGGRLAAVPGAPPAGADALSLLSRQGWWWLGGGPVLVERWRQGSRLALSVQQGLVFIPGLSALSKPWPGQATGHGLNLQVSAGARLELGF